MDEDQHQSEQLSAPSLANSKYVVVDNGTGYCKCGFAADNFPRHSFPSMIGRPMIRSEEAVEDAQIQEIMCGYEAAKYRSMLQITYPIENGIVRNWDDMIILWNYTFEKLGIRPEESHILLTEAPLNPKINRQKMAEIMFEKYGFQGIHVATQAVLTLYAQGLMTGVVMDSGDGVTHIVPVFDGIVMNDITKRIDIAGRNITRYLVELLQQRGYPLNSTADLDTVRAIKEKYCYVGYDMKTEEALATETTVLVENYTLPDGRVIKIGRERYLAPEALFQPRLVDKEVAGIHEQLFNAINEASVDIRREFYQHIVLSGGTSMYPGLPSRLEKEMKELYLKRVLRGDRTNMKKFKLHIEDPPRRKHFVFMGGAVLADVGKTQPGFWVTKADWDEKGPEALFR